MAWNIVRKLTRPAPTSPRRPPRRRRQPLLLEALEDRQLLSTIVWTNRGGGPLGDTDQFDAFYQANADLARTIVDAVISTWEHVIQDFNYQSPGAGVKAPVANTYTLTVTAKDLGDDLRG